MTRDSIISHYDAALALCSRFAKKGKNTPYTSVNGHMFSQVTKEGELAIRFSKDVQQAYIQSLQSDVVRAYGAVLNGYVKIPDALVVDHQRVAELLNESYNYVLSLKAK